MTDSDNEAPPTRGTKHDSLTVFLGEWRAEGESYGSPNQKPDNPKGAPERWTSTHIGEWHTGEFFLVQNERATVGGKPFDTLSVIGVDSKTQRYVLRTFENHGFYREYDLAADGRIWTITGERERARIEFSEDGNTQTITWEWRPSDTWLPLCDRIARRASIDE